MSKVYVSPQSIPNIFNDVRKSALIAMRMGKTSRLLSTAGMASESDLNWRQGFNAHKLDSNHTMQSHFRSDANFPSNGVTFMKNSKTLASELRAKVEEAKTIDDAAKLETITNEVEALGKQLENRQKLERFERQATATPILNGETRELSELTNRFDIGEALADFNAGRELRGAAGEWNQMNPSSRGGISAPTAYFLGETRAISTTTPAGGVGGNLVATNQGETIDRLRPLLAVQGMGATVLSNLTGNLDLPRVKGSGIANWIAEGSNATRTDASFDKVSMSPKSVAAEYQVTRRMLLQATNLESILRTDLSFLLAQALDAAAIGGTGTNQPLGIMNTSNVQTLVMGTNGAAITSPDTFADMIGLLDVADAYGNRGFLTNSKVKKLAMKLKDSQLRPFGIPAVFQNEAVTFSNQVPSNLTKGTGTNLSAAIYGVWSDLIIAYWSNVDIVLNPYHQDVASNGGALLHAFLDADIAVRHPESFVVNKDIIA